MRGCLSHGARQMTGTLAAVDCRRKRGNSALGFSVA